MRHSLVFGGDCGWLKTKGYPSSVRDVHVVVRKVSQFVIWRQENEPRAAPEENKSRCLFACLFRRLLACYFACSLNGSRSLACSLARSPVSVLIR